MTDTYSQATVPPQNTEAEESVLGAMLISEKAIGTVSEILVPTDFYRKSYGVICATVFDLYNQGQPVDAITLSDALDARGELAGVGGSPKIVELASIVPAASNVERYARIVKEMATLRALVNVGQEIQRLGHLRPGEITDIVDRAEQLVFLVSQQRITEDFVAVGDVLMDDVHRLELLQDSGGEITGIPSGFSSLDRLTSGFQPGNLIILAARPSMGKSALAINMCANLALRHATPVAMFTLEMSKSEVVQRLLSAEAGIPSERLRSGRLSSGAWERLMHACGALGSAPIYVDDTSSITMAELRSKARRLKSREPNLGLIVVDYLQLMTSGAGVENRVQEISAISRQLKVLARDVGVPVVALSQLSRAVEQRHDKKPILSDLRESGAIEQDADIVAFVYRDVYYSGKESSAHGLADILVAKHRNGPTDTITLGFLQQYAKFVEVS